LQPRDDVNSRISAAPPEAFRLETDGHSDVGFRLKLKVRRRHTDDGEALVVEREPFPDDARIFAEPSTPESVTQDRRRSRAGTILFRQKVPPDQRLAAQCGKELRRDEPPL